MFTVSGNTIFLTRGDNADIQINLVTESGQQYVPAAEDKVVFRMKRNAKAGKTLIEKEAVISDSITVSFLPEDTIPFDFGDYRYEIELVTGDDEHYTVIADSVFKIGTELEHHV